ncbi:hypothetical protein F4782DRAFT_239873 [Xylaria castorea]|nr:hypothetical protein F4782DRAFT_239873 [Xylaria castorea]
MVHERYHNRMLSWVNSSDIQPPRACDRCHAVKERCEWIPNVKQCERCLRLQHVCETVRPKGRPGRKPGVRGKRLSPGVRSARRTSSGKIDHDPLLTEHRMQRNGRVATVPRCIPGLELGGLSMDEQHLVRRFLFHSHVLDVFSVNSSFGERARRQVIPQMLLSRATFLDGLLACAISWVGDVDSDQANPSHLDACYRHASSAIAMLTSLQVENFETMIDCLMLGALVSTFAVRLRLYDIQAICRRTLGLIEPIYTVSDPARPELRVFLTCLILWELRACIFSCAIPTLRFRPPPEPYADRHVGFCGTLLPLFYDICKIGHAAAHCQMDNAINLKELDAIEQSCCQWQPTVPEDLNTSFNAVEVAHMICQAQAMRAAALLVTHRLRYPFGVNDGPAQVLSMSILSQIEMTFNVTKQPVRCTDLPLLVACIELKEDTGRQKWCSNIATFAGFSPQFREHVQNALRSYWAAIDTSDTISWNKLVMLGFPFLRNTS